MALRSDAKLLYCGRCYVFVDDVLTASPAVRKAMARFHQRNAELRPEHSVDAMAAAAIWESDWHLSSWDELWAEYLRGIS